MKTFKNEKGYALLMVLMLILLFTVLGMGLMATNMNSAKQFSTKENQVQARHQAEMGVLHYGVLLEDKIKNSTAVALDCKEIDKLLGTSKKIAANNYIVGPPNNSETSCKPLENGKLLEIKIKSIGIINDETEKEVEATFYAANKGGGSASPPAGEVIGPPPVPSSTETEVKTILSMKKETKVVPGNLVINNLLDIDGGKSDSLKVMKDLYIAGFIDIQNHACIASGGNFTALNSFNWGSSNSDLLVRKDAYLPSKIGVWHKNQVNVYIFGNLYLPLSYDYSIKKEDDRNLYVGGKVYQLKNFTNGEKKYLEIKNPFKTLQSKQISVANKLPCSVEAATEISPGLPNWVLEDEKIVDYH